MGENNDKSLLVYIFKRVVQALFSLWIVVTVTFFAMHAIPGGPFQSENIASNDTKIALEAKYGLDKPLLTQYFTYLCDVFLHGEFGPSLSYRDRDVSRILSDGIWNSVKIGAFSLIIAELFGLTLGIISAANHEKWIDRIITALTTLCMSVPSFIFGIVLLLLFSVKLKLLPSNGTTVLGRILPVSALCLYPFAQTTRLMRSEVLEELEQGYVRTARMKGLSERKILFKHILKNSSIPIITFSASMLAYIVTGSVAVEQVFAIKGMGRILTSGITNRDYPLIMGATIVMSSVVLLLNLLCDIIYHLVDPRIRYY